MSEPRTPYGALPPDGMIENLITTIEANAQAGTITLSVVVRPHEPYFDAVSVMTASLAPAIAEQLRTLEAYARPVTS